MSETCNHDCEHCSSSCSEKPQFAAQNVLSNTKKVIAVVSGKGGVGKSSVTSMLAVLTARKGFSTAILDADVTGPSIPQAFNLHERATASEAGIFPVETATGIKVMSLNLLLEKESDPVIWRGPMIAGTVTQFWTDILWGDVDYMYVDMPPGTGDVPLTVFQSLPVAGVVIVTTPQELVSLIVEKAVNMAKMMNVPILGIVENMAYFECPDCHSKHYIFGDGKVCDTAKKFGIENYAEIPVNPKLSAACDRGTIELFDGPWLDGLVDAITE